MSSHGEKLAYLAGFFDGEGSIIFRNRGKSPDVMNHCSIHNTERAVLDEFQRTFGGLVNEVHRRYVGHNLKTTTADSKYKTIYSWQISGPSARQFLLSVYPYLRHGEKLEKARCALTFDEDRGSATYGNRTRISRGPRSKAA